MANEKYRNYFIEVNPGASCFSRFKGIVEGFANCRYAYILHDKDTLEDGTAKLEHYHLVICFDNERAYNSIKNIFEGAHIEIVNGLSACIKYLIHKDHADKYQYDPKEIVTNDRILVNVNLNAIRYEPLNESVIVSELLNMKISNKLYGNLTYFYIKYGNEQVKKYRQMIIDLISNHEALDYWLELFSDTTGEKLPF